MDPLTGSPWSARATVDGFARGTPNPVLMDYAQQVLAERDGHRAIDLGCGAGRNAVPLAAQGWRVFGVDLSRPMLDAALARARESAQPIQFAMAAMHTLPARSRTFDLIIAHGIWNLARSSGELRRAIREAARVATDDAALFVFTFSRHTLPASAEPIPGEEFVFTQFSGQPQCFLTEQQLFDEVGREGFRPDDLVPLREYNRPAPGPFVSISGPVIYEGAFRFEKERTARIANRQSEDF
jgi:SAM-dependent methyltransferase